MPTIPPSSSATQQPPGSVRDEVAGALDPHGPARVAAALRGGPVERRIRGSSSKKPSSLTRSAAGTSAAVIGRIAGRHVRP